MTVLQLSHRLAQVIVYGHIFLFIYGFFIWQFGTLEGNDVVQLILLGSPVLALTATAGFQSVVGGPDEDTSPKAHPMKVQMSLTVTSIFIVMLFLAYSITLFHSAITPDEIKLIVGCIETALGGYLGAIKETFFTRR